MKNESSDIEARVARNILKILPSKKLNQTGLSTVTGISEKTMSKILRGEQHFRLEHISKIAKALSLREIDLLTYPDIYVKENRPEANPAEVLLQLRLTQEKKDQVLKLVFGENDIEILNK